MINAGTVGAYLTLDISEFESRLITAGQRLQSFKNVQTDGFLGVGKALLTGLVSFLPALGNAAGRVSGAVGGAFGKLPASTRKSMDSSCAGMKKALENARAGLASAAKLNGGSVVAALDHSLGSTSGGTSAVGQRAADGLVSGMNSRRPAALSSARSLMQSMANAAGSVSFTGIGGNVVSGIMKGINDRAPSLISRAKSLASGVAETVRQTLNVNSPSKVMIPMGQAVAEGMEVGLLNGAGSLYETASAISLETAETLGSISTRGVNLSGVHSTNYGDRLDRLLDAVEKLADSQTTMEIDGRPFGRLVREALA